MITVELALFGYEFEDADIQALRSEFASVGTVRATGGWMPAAGPPAELSAVLTFFGQTLLGIILEKTLEAAWHRFGDSYMRFRENRLARNRFEPECGPLIIRADDVEVRINMCVNPESPDVLQIMQQIAGSLTDGALGNLPIRLIELPSRKNELGEWEKVLAEEYAEDGDTGVWWVEGTSADGPFGFYDSRRGIWVG